VQWTIKIIKVLFMLTIILSILVIPNSDTSLLLRGKYLIVGFCCYMAMFHPSRGSILAADLDDKTVFENFIVRPMACLMLIVLYLDMLGIKSFFV